MAPSARGSQIYPVFCLDAGDENSGPPSCSASAVSTESSPQPLLVELKGSGNTLRLVHQVRSKTGPLKVIKTRVDPR